MLGEYNFVIKIIVSKSFLMITFLFHLASFITPTAIITGMWGIHAGLFS